jgi:hypothetical protein
MTTPRSASPWRIVAEPACTVGEAGTAAEAIAAAEEPDPTRCWSTSSCPTGGVVLATD